MKKATTIAWNEIEEKHDAALFLSKKGMSTTLLRTALGPLIIQKQYEYSDRELVEQVRENPYYHFFGLPGYQDEESFGLSFLVDFRKHLTDNILGDINEMITAYNTSDDDPSAGGSGGDNESGETSTENKETVILNVTCAPREIAYPQDINLLNEACENLEDLIDDICYRFNYFKLCMYY